MRRGECPVNPSLASARAGDIKLPLSLVGERRVGASDADAMIGERRVHGGKVDAGHVAGHTIFRRSRAGFARVALRRGPTGSWAVLTCAFLPVRQCVAREAFRVIRGGIMVERLMRIMAGDAGKARIPISPAAALLQPVRLKAHSFHALCFGFKNVEGSTVTRATKIDFCHRPQAPRIENRLAAFGILLGVHEVRMFGAGTMASFTIHAKD